MHIPDGFLNGRTAAAAGALSLAGLAVALRRTRNLPPKRVPLMGLAAAFVFAAQMLNFPIGGGTSGHLIGGVLCAVLLGPSAAALVISCVLIVQCFVFADGGVLALGANIFNMALVSSVGGYLIFRSVYRLLPGSRGRLVAVAIASWLSTVLAAVVCAGQLALSHTVPWPVAVTAMAGVHAFIGVGEAVITVLVIHAIEQVRPDLIDPSAPSPMERRGFELIGFGLVIAIGLAVFVSPFASSAPDGLDHVAQSLGFRDHEAAARVIASPLPDYRLPGISSAAIGTALAGAAGTLMVFGVGWTLARVLRSRQTDLNVDLAASVNGAGPTGRDSADA
ncbi:MAG TPA: energy-coupling factor ABC transporter permease [Tepidisphaeraceae bacterium]|jgi:cobalt/nickel transport system permease protein|nr:energy-coupling factor ABC transporter permease [Tepidisphaeraceae bacterium]